MDDSPPQNIVSPRRPPLGRLLAVACLVPVLGMIVLGARQYDETRGLRVEPAPAGQPRLVDVAAAPALRRDAPAGDSALASVSGLADVRLTRTVRTVLMEVTAYCPCDLCCGKHSKGITASGKPVSFNGGRFVAADTRVLPFGTQLRVPGYDGGNVVEVADKGGAIKGNKLDVYFPDHKTALRWGRQILPVEVVDNGL